MLSETAPWRLVHFIHNFLCGFSLFLTYHCGQQQFLVLWSLMHNLSGLFFKTCPIICMKATKIIIKHSHAEDLKAAVKESSHLPAFITVPTTCEILSSYETAVWYYKDWGKICWYTVLMLLGGEHDFIKSLSTRELYVEIARCYQQTKTREIWQAGLGS